MVRAANATSVGLTDGDRCWWACAGVCCELSEEDDWVEIAVGDEEEEDWLLGGGEGAKLMSGGLDDAVDLWDEYIEVVTNEVAWVCGGDTAVGGDSSLGSCTIV